MVYNINVELQIRQSNKQSTIEQNGQDKKSESKGETDAADAAKQERRVDNKVGIEVGTASSGERRTASSGAFKGDETPCKCEEGDCKEVVEKTDG
jgi:hypothetical protein